MENKKKLEIVYRDVNDLKPCEYNPRKITPAQEKQIRQSLEEFGFVAPLVVNTNEDRKDIVVGGNQRLMIAKKMGFKEVPTTEENLTLEQEKELNIRLNKNQAEFDQKLLAEHYEKELLVLFGFEEKELTGFIDEYTKEFNSITDSDAELPIVPKFSEKYDYVIIISSSEIDTNWLKQVLEIQKSQSYKSTKTGEAMVLDVKTFEKLWNSK